MEQIRKFLQATTCRSNTFTQGFLTREQANVRRERGLTTHVMTAEGKRYFFFSDDGLFGYANEAQHMVASAETALLPMYTPKGWINTVEDYIAAFHRDDTHLPSYESLIELLGENPSLLVGVTCEA